ncbi:MAG: 16S rRNA (guanine(966)-N(2))-methyltransferase RsmD [Bacteroidales bacterium]|nr:16S rRNA (guanine(966)-N(2))-methyltransferase RsmD [Bacteroidales bacterium]
MRIISGKHKGRRFSPPSSFKARPTTDFARESLFNILSVRYDFEGMAILDLFAGTGIIGLEFYSRGAEAVTLIEINRKHANFIRKNIDTLEADGVKIIQANIKDYLKRSKENFDIIFADPPFDLPWLDTIPDLVLQSGILSKGGLFIIEHPKKHNFAAHTSFSEQRHYGSVNFSFFESKGN